MSTRIPSLPRFEYPSSDGKPMAENTLQFEWIVTIQGNLDLLFRDALDVFVAGDHLIYPIENNARVRQAPDAYVAFGRPKGHRGSYAVAEEEGIFPQVVFEVWSPGNRQDEMEEKRKFYEQYGAEEYYIVYPDTPSHIDGWLRVNNQFSKIEEINGFLSPRLRIKFEAKRGKIALYRPDGKRFLSFVELGTVAEQERQRADRERQRAEEKQRLAEQEGQRASAEQQRADAAEQRAEQERRRAEEKQRLAEQERQRAEQERQCAEQERQRAEEKQRLAEQEGQRASAEQQRADAAEQRAEQEGQRTGAEQQRADAAEQRAAKLAAVLRELGIDPDRE